MIDYKDYGRSAKNTVAWVFGVIDVILVLLIFVELNKVSWGLLW
jgi:hypothetical protein